MLMMGTALCTISSPHQRDDLTFNFRDRHTTAIHFLGDIDAISSAGSFEQNLGRAFGHALIARTPLTAGKVRDAAISFYPTPVKVSEIVPETLAKKAFQASNSNKSCSTIPQAFNTNRYEYSGILAELLIFRSLFSWNCVR